MATGSGDTLTQRELEQLLREPAYRPRVAALLARWGLTLDGEDDATTVRTADGDAVDVADLHASVQGDPVRRRDLYQLAMDLWR